MDLLQSILSGAIVVLGGVVCFLLGSFLRKPKVSKVLELVAELATALTDGSITKEEAEALAARIRDILGKPASK